MRHGINLRKLKNKYAYRGFPAKFRKILRKNLLRPLISKHILNKANTLAVIALFLLAVFLFLRPSVPSKVPDADNFAAFSFSPNTISDIKEISEKYGYNFYEMMFVYSAECSFAEEKELNIRSKEQIEKMLVADYKNIRKKYKISESVKYEKLLENILGEIKYFPVEQGSASYIYGDSWGNARNYKGNRRHLGCDIMDRENIRGRLQVKSMTDGVIQNIGWNELGGYRVGITASSGTYYYYAHLESFAEGLEKGSFITAGQTIGYMGDTGYSKDEGTTGNFAVHLHVGIMPVLDNKKDYWINPYPFLRFIEQEKTEI
ncbi:MAG: M23 family metallopeptidase [Clostridiales bacterium]|nr:M23 family metallopeptidase [Clostridiales bacterium]